MRKVFLILSLVSLTLAVGANDAFAQRSWDGAGGGGMSNYRGGYYGWSYGGWGSPGPFGGYYGSPYYYGGGYSPYYRNDFGLGYFYAAPNYYLSEASMTQLPSINVRQSFYADPGSSTITVFVPNQDAKIWFDNAQTAQRGMERTFHAALQQAGAYTVKASWTDNGRTVNQERRIQVQPGQSAMVDFRTNVGEDITAPNSRE
jgi:uncharacterized protein (TIGR03000 family)